jgi:hypothetical protein
MTLQNAPPGLDYERDKKFTRVNIFKMTSIFFNLSINSHFATINSYDRTSSKWLLCVW